MKFAKEIKVGIFAVAALLALLSGIGYLQGRSVFANAVRLHAVFKNIDGLKEGGFVFFNGYTIGTVSDIDLRPETGQLLVTFDITETRNIPVDSKIVITPTDLFGNKGMTLFLGKSKQLVANGDTLADSLALGMVENLQTQLMPLKDKIEKVVEEVYIITKAARETVQDSVNRVNRIAKNIEATTANVQKITHDFSSSAQRVNALTDSIKMLVSDYRNNPEIKAILRNTRTVTDSLAASTKDFKQVVVSTKKSVESLQAVMNSLQKGEGTAGKLIYDPKLYSNLTDASKSLDSLLVDLRKNPKRYVHFSLIGRKSK